MRDQKSVPGTADEADAAAHHGVVLPGVPAYQIRRKIVKHIHQYFTRCSRVKEKMDFKFAVDLN